MKPCEIQYAWFHVCEGLPTVWCYQLLRFSQSLTPPGGLRLAPAHRLQAAAWGKSPVQVVTVICLTSLVRDTQIDPLRKLGLKSETPIQIKAWIKLFMFEQHPLLVGISSKVKQWLIKSRAKDWSEQPTFRHFCIALAIRRPLGLPTSWKHQTTKDA